MKEKADILKWVRCWEKAGSVMKHLRRDNLDHVDVRQAIEAVDDVFESAILQIPLRKISGFVEMQAWFAKASQ